MSAGVVVRGHAKQDGLAFASGKHFDGPVGHQFLIAFGDLLTCVVKHHRKLIALTRDVAEIGLFPMDLRERMPARRRWVWGEAHPDFMDALMPLASLPTQISGRNRVWRRIILDAGPAGTAQDDLVHFLACIKRTVGVVPHEALLIMSDLCRKAAERLRLVVTEPAIRRSRPTVLSIDRFQSVSCAPTLAALNDGPLHNQSSEG
jgi:hypothetical protein